MTGTRGGSTVAAAAGSDCRQLGRVASSVVFRPVGLYRDPDAGKRLLATVYACIDSGRYSNSHSLSRL